MVRCVVVRNKPARRWRDLLCVEHDIPGAVLSFVIFKCVFCAAHRTSLYSLFIIRFVCFLCSFVRFRTPCFAHAGVADTE